MKNETIYCVDMGGGKSSCVVLKDIAPTLACTHYGEPVIMTNGKYWDGTQTVGTLSARNCGGGSKDA